MSQTKVEFCKAKITELIDEVIQRENLREGHRSFDSLQWVKFYVKDLTSDCKDCADKEKESQNESES